MTLGQARERGVAAVPQVERGRVQLVWASGYYGGLAGLCRLKLIPAVIRRMFGNPRSLMIVGDENGFAIEYEVDTPVERYWVFGRLSYRVRGLRVGDYAAGCSLSVAVGAFETLLGKAGKRNDERLLGLPLAVAFSEIDSALFSDDSRSDAEVRRDQELYARFLAVPRGLDVFDDCLAFLVEGETQARLIWDGAPNWGEPGEFWLPRGRFDQTISDCVRALSVLMDEVAPRGGERV